MVDLNASPMHSDLRAAVIMRNNVRALLVARKDSQAALAHWLRHSRSWINKFLNGDRQIQLKDLDRVADFFGLATYQLFQPGIGSLTERRVQERRKRPDRRIGHARRELDYLRQQVSPIVLKTRGKVGKKASTPSSDP